MLVILVIFSSLCLLYILSTRCRKGHRGLQPLRGWVYAHRGLHGNGVPENSMAAFHAAKDAGCGIELDVHLLRDGTLAVMHDASLKRTAGCDVYMEDLTHEQLKDYCLEGTKETIPSFAQVLELFDGAAPIIVELKCERNNYAQLCDAACKLLDTYAGVYCLESFDPRCIAWLRKNRPDLVRGQLAENYFRSKTSPLPWYLKLVLSCQMLNFLTLPDFVSYRYADRKHVSNFLSRRLWGAQGVTWTITRQKDLDIAVREGWIPIFEGFRP